MKSLQGKSPQKKIEYGRNKTDEHNTIHEDKTNQTTSGKTDYDKTKKTNETHIHGSGVSDSYPKSSPPRGATHPSLS